MAAGDVPRCPECQQKQTLSPVPESGQPLIESKHCHLCRKLQKTFVDIPRPAFNRSVSCPARSNVVSYVQQGGEPLSASLTDEEDKDDSEDVKKIDFGVNFCSESSPRQRVCRVISKQTVIFIAIGLFLVLIVLICVLFYGVFSGRSSQGEGPTHNTPSPLNHGLTRNVTVFPHHQHCTSHSLFLVDVSKPKASDNQSTTVSFRLVNSSDNSVSLSEDGQTIHFNKAGLYDIDVDFIMDTYSLDSVSQDRSYHQTLCLNITSRPPVCRPLIMREWMRLPLSVNAKVRAHYGQRLSVFVKNHKILFPDPNGNMLSIVKRYC
ncbi:uncharacterized protein LOC133197897 [Saccostrea echinata]|uniref:uncharacterized protein LOC133197897 n=1 Tax=Saccostrea echinata TaxID=191078 RepID=UPI002A83BCF9|nr:uncharacterized protein LOC133197897 [Saccostrea echinata]